MVAAGPTGMPATANSSLFSSPFDGSGGPAYSLTACCREQTRALRLLSAIASSLVLTCARRPPAPVLAGPKPAKLALLYSGANNQRLAKHLRHEQPHLFTFLRSPGLHATNNFAERAIRLMAMARKTWGGNRTANGARTQQILASVLRTCW